jgi:Holliday junction DNA helicase RuvA
MISHLSGTLIEKAPPALVVDVGGVGYELEAPMTTFYRLPESGAAVSLYTHLVVREDAHVLFGFGTRDERTLFRALIKVNGVGPKVALAILSGMEAPQFIRCITTHDTSSLVRIPGIGRKTAERLIVEMQDRLPSTLGTALNPGQPALTPSAPQSMQDARGDAESALIALGYKPQEASKAVSAIDVDGLRSEEIIRLALRGMVRAS